MWVTLVWFGFFLKETETKILMQVGFGEIIPGTSKKEMGKGEREQDADKGCFNHASCLELHSGTVWLMPLSYPSHGVRWPSYLLIYINPVFGYLSTRLPIHLLTHWLLDKSSHWISSLALSTYFAPRPSILPSLTKSAGILLTQDSQWASKGAGVRHQHCQLLCFLFKN